jgi:hypothetical protein
MMERVTPGGAVRFGVATIVAVPFAAVAGLAQALGTDVEGRVILDTSNAIPGRDGAAAQAALSSGEGTGGAVARMLVGARVVKAFNTIHVATLARTAGATPPVGVPLAGDDPAAVAIAAGVVAAAGFAPVPAGPLRAAARFDFGTPLFNVAMTEADLRLALAVRG